MTFHLQIYDPSGHVSEQIFDGQGDSPTETGKSTEGHSLATLTDLLREVNRVIELNDYTMASRLDAEAMLPRILSLIQNQLK